MSQAAMRIFLFTSDGSKAFQATLRLSGSGPPEEALEHRAKGASLSGRRGAGGSFCGLYAVEATYQGKEEVAAKVEV